MRAISYKKKWRIQDMLDSIGVTDKETITAAYVALGSMTFKQLRYIEKNADYFFENGQPKKKKIRSMEKDIIRLSEQSIKDMASYIQLKGNIKILIKKYERYTLVETHELIPELEKIINP